MHMIKVEDVTLGDIRINPEAIESMYGTSDQHTHVRMVSGNVHNLRMPLDKILQLIQEDSDV